MLQGTLPSGFVTRCRQASHTLQEALDSSLLLYPLHNKVLKEGILMSGVQMSFFCPGHILTTIRDINMKLHRTIDLIERKCSAQELCISYFWIYWPLLIFMLNICPGLILKTIVGFNLKLQVEIFHLVEVQRTKF